jgi:hypothetical protein
MSRFSAPFFGLHFLSLVRFAFLVFGRLMYNLPVRRPRARHHTGDANLDRIRVDGVLENRGNGCVRATKIKCRE